MLRNADSGAVLPGIDTPTGNPLLATSLTPASAVSQSRSGAYYYDPTHNRIVVTQAGAVLSGLDFNGVSLDILANNVTVKDCSFEAGNEYWCITQAGSGAVIEQNTFSGGSAGNTYEMAAFIASSNQMFVLGNSFLNAPGDGIDFERGRLGQFFLGAGYSSTGVHPDAILVGSTTGPVSITDNFIDATNAAGATGSRTGETNSAVRITAEMGDTSNVSVTGNFLLGGTYTVDPGVGGSGPSATSTSATITSALASMERSFPARARRRPSAATSSSTSPIRPPPPGLGRLSSGGHSDRQSRRLVGRRHRRIRQSDDPLRRRLQGANPWRRRGKQFRRRRRHAISVGRRRRQHLHLSRHFRFDGQRIRRNQQLRQRQGRHRPQPHRRRTCPPRACRISPSSEPRRSAVAEPRFATSRIRTKMSPMSRPTSPATPRRTSVIVLGGLQTLTAANFALTPAQSNADLANGAALGVSLTRPGGLFDYHYTNVREKPYTSYDAFYTNTTTRVADDLNLSATSERTDLSGSNLTVTKGSGTESLLAKTTPSRSATMRPRRSMRALRAQRPSPSAAGSAMKPSPDSQPRGRAPIRSSSPRPRFPTSTPV